MSAANTIGGYFVELGLVTDDKSFNAGQHKIDDFEQTTRKLFGTVVKASTALFGMATAAGAVETAELKASRAIGISAGDLDKWKVAAGMAGTNADGLVSSMSQLESKMQKLKLGQVDMGLAKSLGFIGIGYGDFSRMNSDQRMKTVFSRAGAMGDQQKAAQLVGDVLGDAAKDYYYYLQASGKTLTQQLAEAQALTFTTEKSKQGAMAFHGEVKALFGAFKSAGSLFGSEFGEAITPLVKKVKEFVIENKMLIQQKVADFAHGAADAFERLFGVIARVAPIVERMVDKFGGLDKILIKVGLGFAAVKIGNFAMGIAQVVRGVGLLKTALMGIGMGAAFLVLEDIMGYFTGQDSVLGYIINNTGPEIKKLKEAFSGLFGIFNSNGNNIADFIDTIKTSLGNFAIGGVKTAISLLTDLVNLMKNLLTGNWEEAGKSIKQFYQDWNEGITGMFQSSERTESAAELNKMLDSHRDFSNGLKEGLFGNANYKNLSENEKNSVARYYAEYGNTSGLHIENIDMFDLKKRSEGKKTSGITITSSSPIPTSSPSEPWYAPAEKKSNKKTDKKINDGIVYPNGRITQVAPDDWVFAAKNVQDMAAAFMPSSVNNTNAPQSATINQYMTFRGSAEPQTVRAAARQGATDAFGKVFSHSANIIQMMPGAR